MRDEYGLDDLVDERVREYIEKVYNTKDVLDVWERRDGFIYEIELNSNEIMFLAAVESYESNRKTDVLGALERFLAEKFPRKRVETEYIGPELHVTSTDIEYEIDYAHTKPITVYYQENELREETKGDVQGKKFYQADELRKKYRAEVLKNKKKLKENTIIERRIKNEINRDLTELTRNTYFPNVPLDDIFNILEKRGLIVLQIDGTKFDGFLAGNEGKALLEIGYVETKKGAFYKPIENVLLTISWYQMESSNYEVITYLS